MKHFTTAIKDSIEERNWCSALFMSLAMPDICGALETPDDRVGDRYRRWFTQHLEPEYSPMFSADDCYRLRCAVLHQGVDTAEKARTDRVMFVEPPGGGAKIHRNVIGTPDYTALQLQIDVFCDDVAQAVDDWAIGVVSDDDIQRRIGELLVIEPPSALRPFIAVG